MRHAGSMLALGALGSLPSSGLGAVAPAALASEPVGQKAGGDLLAGDLLAALRSGADGLAPPPSTLKCLAATLAGSLFALMGMVLEKRRAEREELEQPKPAAEPPRARASSASSSSCPGTPVLGGLGTSSPSRASCGPLFRARLLSEEQLAERRVKSILNKLTRERFEVLYEQLLECCACSADMVAVVAREVFAKATVQHGFIEMYADLCARLHRDAKVETSFKRALLEQCQQSFKAYLSPPKIDESLAYEEKYEELVKYKTKMLGNVRLIGNLLRLRMLNGKIIFYCTEELLSIASPEALETLAAFLETLGAAFDSTDWPGQPRLEEVFQRLEHIARDRSRPARTRCLLQDLLDKRRSRWQGPRARSASK